MFSLGHQILFPSKLTYGRQTKIYYESTPFTLGRRVAAVLDGITAPALFVIGMLALYGIIGTNFAVTYAMMSAGSFATLLVLMRGIGLTREFISLKQRTK